MKLDGIKVYTLLKKQEKTQLSLAEMVGVSRVTIGNVVNGRSCSQETAEKIAAALGVSLSEITDKRK